MKESLSVFKFKFQKLKIKGNNPNLSSFQGNVDLPDIFYKLFDDINEDSVKYFIPWGQLNSIPVGINNQVWSVRKEAFHCFNYYCAFSAELDHITVLIMMEMSFKKAVSRAFSC